MPRSPSPLNHRWGGSGGIKLLKLRWRVVKQALVGESRSRSRHSPRSAAGKRAEMAATPSTPYRVGTAGCAPGVLALEEEHPVLSAECTGRRDAWHRHTVNMSKLAAVATQGRQPRRAASYASHSEVVAQAAAGRWAAASANQARRASGKTQPSSSLSAKCRSAGWLASLALAAGGTELCD